MQSFHGDLLLGGAAIREVQGLIEDDDHVSKPTLGGRFRVNANQESMLELNRTYLLMLDDGSSAKIVVTDVSYEDEADDTIVVQFRPR